MNKPTGPQRPTLLYIVTFVVVLVAVAVAVVVVVFCLHKKSFFFTFSEFFWVTHILRVAKEKGKWIVKFGGTF